MKQFLLNLWVGLPMGQEPVPVLRQPTYLACLTNPRLRYLCLLYEWRLTKKIGLPRLIRQLRWLIWQGRERYDEMARAGRVDVNPEAQLRKLWKEGRRGI